MARLAVAFIVGTVAGAVVAALIARRHEQRRPARTEAWSALRTEIERARRYDHVFALVRLWAPTTGGSTTDLSPAAVVRRRTDHAWRLAGSTYLLLPETTREGAQRHVERLRRRDGERALWARIACFPRDGLTADALLWALSDTPPDRRAGRGRADEEAVS